MPLCEDSLAFLYGSSNAPEDDDADRGVGGGFRISGPGSSRG
jgi:hypothetical protein